MDAQLAKYKEMGEAILLHGQDFLFALLILVIGLIVIKNLTKPLRVMLEKFGLRKQMVSTVSNIIYIILLFIVISATLQQVGMNILVIRRLLIGIGLAAIGVISIFRPLLPTLPFKVGNTVKIGNLLGKIEATTILNTRMRTFDGKTVFIPNSKILNDYVINYHFTDTRRIKVDITIRYPQDIPRAKQILEAIIIEDPRALNKPARPVVYVLGLVDGCIKLGGRCWVNNENFWQTKCELLEKAILRFEKEGITIAFPQQDVHLYHDTSSPTVPEDDNWPAAERSDQHDENKDATG